MVRAGELETLVREERGVHPLENGTFGVKGTDMQSLGAAPLGEGLQSQGVQPRRGSGGPRGGLRAGAGGADGLWRRRRACCPLMIAGILR